MRLLDLSVLHEGDIVNVKIIPGNWESFYSKIDNFSLRHLEVERGIIDHVDCSDVSVFMPPKGDLPARKYSASEPLLHKVSPGEVVFRGDFMIRRPLNAHDCLRFYMNQFKEKGLLNEG